MRTWYIVPRRMIQLSFTAPTGQVVFKYFFLFHTMDMVWNELNLWMRLPDHPHIVPFDKLVVDEIARRVVGFTSAYIGGRTLEENKTRVFKLKWLKQLISAGTFSPGHCTVQHLHRRGCGQAHGFRL